MTASRRTTDTKPNPITPLHLTRTTLGLLLLAAAWPGLDRLARADEAPRLAGSWSWSWKDPSGQTHRHLLEVEGVGQKLAARERFDELEPTPVRDLKLDDATKTVRFTVVRGQRRADYKGVVSDGDTIRGTVIVTADGQSSENRWEAKREEKEQVKEKAAKE
jgi:hypothetical protein